MPSTATAKLALGLYLESEKKLAPGQNKTCKTSGLNSKIFTLNTAEIRCQNTQSPMPLS